MHRLCAIGFALIVLVAAFAFVAACGDDDDDDVTNDAPGDDDTADDDTGDDDAGDDDAGDDDTGDDDSGPAPTYPDNHQASWNCYLCHEGFFRGSPGEPHAGAYTAPDDCVGCHAQGAWTNGRYGPPGHNFILDCLNCHEGNHGKTWEDKSQCVVCHQR